MQISLWHQCLRRLEAELPEQAFNTWIRPLQAVEDGDRLRLLAPNRYVVDWVNQNCTARISELVDELMPAPVPQVTVEIGSRRQPLPTPTQMTAGIGLPVQPQAAVRSASHGEPQFGNAPRRTIDPLPQFGGRLNAEFTFAILRNERLRCYRWRRRLHCSPDLGHLSKGHDLPR